MTAGDPALHADLPASQLTALTDLTVLLEGYERLDQQAGLGAQLRSTRERTYHLGQLIMRLREAIHVGRGARPLLLAIAAQAIQWAAATDEHR